MATSEQQIATLFGDGRYRLLGRIGKGSMGHVYRAYDRHLQTVVVVKFPLRDESGFEGSDLLERFGREVRSLVNLSHPHIVKILDVGARGGQPYVVMQYLAGGSSKDRMEREFGQPSPMPPQTLNHWLMDVAKALDFIHAQNYIHRNIKPANILFDAFGNVFLGDFGIVKMLSAQGEPMGDSSLTAPGFLLGTPNYVAPEVVMGRGALGRVDQYSLALTVHEVLTGKNCMAGLSPSATIVNQTTLDPPPLCDVIPGVSRALSDAILRGLAKEPGDRFETCAQFACEVLLEVEPLPSAAVDWAPTPSEAAGIACPKCQFVLPIDSEHEGERVLCDCCQAAFLVEAHEGGVVLTPEGSSSDSWRYLPLEPEGVSPGQIIVCGDDEQLDPSAATAPVAVPREQNEGQAQRGGATRLDRKVAMRLAGAAAALAVIAGAVANRGFHGQSSRNGARQVAKPLYAARDRAVPPALGAPPDQPIEVNIAYGTEKKLWLEQALKAYRDRPAGKASKINLVGMGSVEGAQAILRGPQPVPIHVWSPASNAYRDVFETEWRKVHKNAPIQKAENLALTPMVFVMWRPRHDLFVKRYEAVTFKTIAQAMNEQDGWATIAGQPDWGRFKFGHTHPNKSNSGFLTLVLMAYEFSRKERNLRVADVARPQFQNWLEAFERGVTRHGASLTNSTGTMMREMVLRGPSQYDCLVVYENLAIEFMDAARDRWGELHVSYPVPNIWNDHPFYILDVPWSSAAHRAAAADFLEFLMSEAIQRAALEHGFRPGNPSITVNFPESPLARHAQYGVRIQVPNMGESPRAEVVNSLLAAYERIEQ
jgi:serine/threonine-protein kinase